MLRAHLSFCHFQNVISIEHHLTQRWLTWSYSNKSFPTTPIKSAVAKNATITSSPATSSGGKNSSSTTKSAASGEITVGLDVDVDITKLGM